VNPLPSFADRPAIERHQLGELQSLTRHLLATNAFYRPRLLAAGIDELASLDEYSRRLPFTWKKELVLDQAENPPYGTNLGRPVEEYTRLHQTSGSTGAPMFWLDTGETWRWLTRAWTTVLEAAGVDATDRVFVAFSFGPFLGLWLAFEAAQAVGAMVLSGGALDTEGRLRTMIRHRTTVLCCTPTYALRLVRSAAELGIDLGECAVRKIIVAGEPGGCLAPVRSQLEEAFAGARVFDHYGMTEVGPVTYQCTADPGSAHVAEAFYRAEAVDPATGASLPLDGGSEGELVLTGLGRVDSPLLRYRTGDLVRPLAGEPCACGRPDLRLLGGVLGRVDDMVVVRGVNLFPAAVDEIVLRHEEVVEYRCEIRSERGMHELEVLLEPRESTRTEDHDRLVRAVENDFRQSHHLRVPVRMVPPGSLPRFELKARRWVLL